MAHVEIKSRFDDRVLFSGEFGSLRIALEVAVKGDANLRGAYLSGADLSGADLSDANLRGAKSDPATPEEIARLDAVREIVLNKPERLNMDLWHSDNWTPDHTPEEEHACGSAHCIAGWLQALSPDEKVRQMEPLDAGKLLAPVSSYMFFTDDKTALEWLKDRRYAAA